MLSRPPPCCSAPQIQLSTASDPDTCHKSWLLGDYGQPLLDSHGQRVRPRSNELRLNLMVQALVLVGAFNGTSRGFEPAQLGRLLMQPVPMLMGMLGAALETDGFRRSRVCLLSLLF